MIARIMDPGTFGQHFLAQIIVQVVPVVVAGWAAMVVAYKSTDWMRDLFGGPRFPKR